MTKNSATPSKARLRLARSVRSRRRNHQWSQELLAEYAGLHRNYVGAIERGEQNVGIDSLEKLADAFGIKLWELLRDG